MDQELPKIVWNRGNECPGSKFNFLDYNAVMLPAFEETRKIFPKALEEAGFYKKTKFVDVSFFLIIADPKRRQLDVIEYGRLERGKTLAVYVYLSVERVQTEEAKGMSLFIMQIALQSFEEICQKYKLDFSPFQTLRVQNTRPLGSESGAAGELDDVESDTDDFEIHIKLPPNSIPGEELPYCLQVADLCEKIFLINNIGKFVGAELGGGFRVIAFAVKDPRVAFKLIQPHITDLPKNSKITADVNGEQIVLFEKLAE